MNERVKLPPGDTEARKGTDLELAHFWSRHLSAPCNPGPGRESSHVGPVYLRQARSALAEMRGRPVEEKNEKAIRFLDSAIRRYLEVNGEPESKLEKEPNLSHFQNEIAKVIRYWQTMEKPDATALLVGESKKFSKPAIAEWINTLSFVKEIESILEKGADDDMLAKLADKSPKVLDNLKEAMELAHLEGDEASKYMLGALVNKFGTFYMTLGDWKIKHNNTFETVKYLSEDVVCFKKAFEI